MTAPPRIVVEGWDPEFGSSFPSPELEPSSARVDPGIEMATERWRPLPAERGLEDREVAFVDGVRRVDALVWIVDPEGDVGPTLGLCASCAAGMVKANAVTNTLSGRYLFTAAELASLTTDAGTFEARVVSAASSTELSVEVQNALRELETEVAERDVGEALVVIDGPLSQEHTRSGALGYIKTHRVSYLDASLTRIVHALGPGERTPLFLTSTSWERYACYLRLPGAQEHPWAGIVRLEVSGRAGLEEARRLTNVAQACLPRYASVPHKEPRAPQNLFPIGGLERELRRRLGDARLVHRAIRAAAGGHGAKDIR